MSENEQAPVNRVVQRGLWFEEFTEETIYEHRPGRTRHPKPPTCGYDILLLGE